MSETPDDFEAVVPPPIDDCDDDSWDDDVLPPPYISDDETSVDSEYLDLYISESNALDSEPAASLHDDFGMPSQVHPPPVPAVATITPPSHQMPPSIQDDDAFMPSVVYSPFAPEVATTTTPLSDSKPAAVLDYDIAMPSPVHSHFVPEVSSATPLSDLKPVPVLDEVVPMPSPAQTPFVSEAATIVTPSNSKPTAVLDNDVDMPPLVPLAATTYAAFPDILPKKPPPQPSESIYSTNTKEASLPPQEESWHPEPSAPFEEKDIGESSSAYFEATNIEESESAVSLILDALDPSERESFLWEQSKILANIKRQTSEERASSEMALKMMAMENDAALAKKLQEEERAKHQQQILTNGNGKRVKVRGTGKTQRALREGKAVKVECLSCHKSMYVPQATEVMYCPVCKDVRTFRKRTSKSKTGGFLGRMRKGIA